MQHLSPPDYPFCIPNRNVGRQGKLDAWQEKNGPRWSKKISLHPALGIFCRFFIEPPPVVTHLTDLKSFAHQADDPAPTLDMHKTLKVTPVIPVDDKPNPREAICQLGRKFFSMCTMRNS